MKPECDAVAGEPTISHSQVLWEGRHGQTAPVGEESCQCWLNSHTVFYWCTPAVHHSETQSFWTPDSRGLDRVGWGSQAEQAAEGGGKERALLGGMAQAVGCSHTYQFGEQVAVMAAQFTGAPPKEVVGYSKQDQGPSPPS